MLGRYVRLYQKVKENWLWPTDREFTKLEAWIDLIISAGWQARERKINGENFIEERGKYITSQRFLGKRWNWTHKKVRCFLDKLEKEGQIKRERAFPNGSRQPNRKMTRIIITNYEKYQNSANLQLASNAQPKGTKNISQPCRFASERGRPKGTNNIQQHIEDSELEELASLHLVYVSKHLTIDKEFHEALCKAYPTVDPIEEYPKIEVEALANPERFRGRETVKAWIKREANKRNQEKASRPSYYRYNDQER